MTGTAASEPVGQVLGTDDATPLSYWVGLAPGQVLQLDDVVLTERILPGGSRVTISGVVSQVRARLEGARYDTDVFLVSEGVLPAQVAESAEVLATRVAPEFFVPPLPGPPSTGPRGRTGRRRCTSTRWRRAFPPGWGATAPPSTSTSTSWTGPAAPT